MSGTYRPTVKAVESGEDLNLSNAVKALRWVGGVAPLDAREETS